MRCFLRTRIATPPAGSLRCAGGGSSARASRCPCTPRETIAAIMRRTKRLDHCRFVPVSADRRHRLGDCTIGALTVPHARERRFPTFAWRLTAGGRTLVYASDVARLTGELDRLLRQRRA